MFTSPGFASANVLSKTPSLGSLAQFSVLQDEKYLISKTSSGLTYQTFTIKTLAILSTGHMFCLTC